MPDKYVAIGPDLYMRTYYDEGHRDSWLAKYETDNAAQKAAIRWNKRNEAYNAEIDRLQSKQP